MKPGGEARADAGAPRASVVKTHATLAIGLLICAAAFWVEVRRAIGGNALSWAYVFEWPLLAGFAVYMWWRILHPASARAEKPVAPEFASMLRAWEEHRGSAADPAGQPGADGEQA